MRWYYNSSTTYRPGVGEEVLASAGTFKGFIVLNYDAKTQRWYNPRNAAETYADSRIIRWTRIEEDELDKLSPARRIVMTIIAKEIQWDLVDQFSKTLLPGSVEDVPGASDAAKLDAKKEVQGVQSVQTNGTTVTKTPRDKALP